MDLTDEEKDTLDYYDTHAKEWVNKHTGDESFWSDELTKFHKLLPAGKILKLALEAAERQQSLSSLVIIIQVSTSLKTYLKSRELIILKEFS